jgi:AcrR family transcriptional regulator
VTKTSQDRLLEIAIRLFSERGFRETTVGDIEKAAGLTPRAGGFYRHFSSKEEVLVQAVRRISDEMIEELRLEDVVALKKPRAELMMIAKALIRHTDTHRPLRVILQREAHRLPALRDAARQANARLAAMDVVPWLEHALRRAGRTTHNAREIGLIVFGPVLVYILGLDRGDAAFGLKDDAFLETWAEHWAAWFESGAGV